MVVSRLGRSFPPFFWNFPAKSNARCCNARIRVRNKAISFAFGLSNDERISWKVLWRVVLFLLYYHTNLMRVDQSLFGFRSEHLVEPLSAPHQYANATSWLAARTRRRGCCSRRALYRPSLRGCARPRFIDPNMAGRSPGLPVPETTLLFALLWRTRVVIRHAPAASHVPSNTAREHDTSTPDLVRPRGRAPTSESGVREYTPHFRCSSRTARTRTKWRLNKKKRQNDHQSGMGGSQSAALRRTQSSHFQIR